MVGLRKHIYTHTHTCAWEFTLPLHLNSKNLRSCWELCTSGVWTLNKKHILWVQKQNKTQTIKVQPLQKWITGFLSQANPTFNIRKMGPYLTQKVTQLLVQMIRLWDELLKTTITGASLPIFKNLFRRPSYFPSISAISQSLTFSKP